VSNTVVVAGEAPAPTLMFRFALFGDGIATVGLKVTVIVQVACDAKELAHDGVRLNWLESVPLMLVLVTGRDNPPAAVVLVMTTVCPALVALSDALNVSAVCETVYVGTMTVPLSVTVVVAGVAGAPTLKFRFAVLGFGVTEVGWNVTDMVQALLPAVAGRIAGQDDAANPAPELAPVMLTLAIESGAPLLLVLVMVTVCAAVVPFSGELNVSEVCETLYVGTNKVPVRRTL